MDLHPVGAVEAFGAKHVDALGIVGAYLDQAVQKTMAKYEDEFPIAEDLPGDALCSGVRALLWKALKKSKHMAGASLFVVPNHSSKKLSDGCGITVRVRRHPWNYKLNRRVAIVPAPTSTLFGEDLAAVPYELAIFRSPNYRAKVMANAVLAAVGDLDDDVPEIYYARDLPHVDLLTLLADEATAADQASDDGFPELGEEESGSDRA